MFHKRSLRVIALLTAAIFSVQGQPSTNADCDYTTAYLYDGWGWNPVTRQSCEPLPNPDNSDCDYSDAALYDGWGWNSFTQQSCPPLTSDQDDQTVNDNPLVGECIDSDGDGWGWDGVSSCLIESADENNNSDDTETDIYAYCEDSDYDGWGWNGVGSCRKAYRLRNSDVILPPINSVRWKTQDLEGRFIQCNHFSYQDNGTYDYTSIAYNFMSGGNVLLSGGVFGENTLAQWYVTQSGAIGNWANFNLPAYETSAGYTFVSGFLINNYGPNEVDSYDVCFPVNSGSQSANSPLRATG